MNRTIEAEIAGRKYLLLTDENEAYVSELSSVVTSRIFDIRRKSGASALDCVTMAALTFADELQKERLKREKLMEVPSGKGGKART